MTAAQGSQSISFLMAMWMAVPEPGVQGLHESFTKVRCHYTQRRVVSPESGQQEAPGTTDIAPANQEHLKGLRGPLLAL